MKRFLATFVFAIIALSNWAYDACIDGIYYNVNGTTKEAEVTYLYYDLYGTSNRNAYSGVVVIPETITYKNEVYNVTSIGDYAFSCCSNITSVTIPNSVTSIGERAFYYCTGLTSVTIPNSVTSIGDYAFFHCSGLTSVTIPNSVTSIGESAFCDCSSLPVIDNIRYADTYLVKAVDKTLSEYNIKSDTRFIGNEAFSGCSGLTSVTIPNSVTSIGRSAFYGCSSLPVIDNIRYADTYLVEAVDNTLLEYNIKSGTRFIGSGAFAGCTGLISVTIPNSVTSIGYMGFWGCSGLTSVTIPNSVTSIGDYAFEDCSGLTSVTIPNSVTSIGGCAFSSCTGLTTITVEEGNTVYDSRNNCNAIIETASNTLIAGCVNTIIPNSVTSIGDNAFDECFGLTSVTIPNSVTSIGEFAFYVCTGLTSVTIGNSVTSIGRNAFAECSGLASVTIPNSVTCIGDWAFSFCFNINTVYWNANLDSSPFCDSSNMIRNIYVGDDVETLYTTFSDCSNISKVVLGKNIKYIRAEAFKNSKYIKDFYVTGDEPPYLYPNVFAEDYLSGATLYIPNEDASYYQSTSPWSKFGKILTLDGDTPSVTKPKCDTPTISYEDSKLVFYTTTPDATVKYNITCADIKSSEGFEVPLTATYNITAYAAKSEYDNSDIATATLVWATGTLETEDINEVKSFSVDALPLLISQDNGFVTISGLQNGDVITVYTTNGTEVTKSQASGSAALLNLTELQGKVAILSINGKSAKIMVK